MVELVKKRAHAENHLECKMHLSDFDYNLPPELISAKPLEKRDESKLLHLSRNGEIKDCRFFDIVDFINPGDLIIFNNSKVIPSRLEGEIDGKKAEATLIKNLEKTDEFQIWSALTKPAKRFEKSKIFFVNDTSKQFVAEVISDINDGEITLKFNYNINRFYELLSLYGQMPLPPYIAKKRKPDESDKQNYQTVYAEKEGSVAAPTAGLHFTTDLIDKLKNKGINFAEVTLHVGLGTFLPVKVEDVTQHKMHSEYCEISQETADLINQTKRNGKRIIAIGTTSLRTLESAPFIDNKISRFFGETDIFIYPSYDFKIPDILITNFHLPKSTLLMLVSAFAGTENIRKAYTHAINNNYRFFSYGDACFLEKNS